MKVAIPLFGTRVSPRFDCGTALLVAEVSQGAAATTAEHVLDRTANSLQRIARLRTLGVGTVICGAITGFALRHLVANGIQVFPGVFCEASDALDAFARGELTATLPYGTGRGRGRARRHRGRGRDSSRWPR